MKKRISVVSVHVGIYEVDEEDLAAPDATHHLAHDLYHENYGWLVWEEECEHEVVLVEDAPIRVLP